MKDFLTKNMLIKALALVLAILLWILARGYLTNLIR